MKKTPTIFLRDPKIMSLVTSNKNPECEWVFVGEGVATRKYDGTCCLVDDGVLYKRRELKAGQSVPENFRLADTDELTGKSVGWVPVDDNNPQDRWHVEAFSKWLPNGTYELMGPKIQGNPECISCHFLLKHSDAHVYIDVPRDFDGLKGWIFNKDIEGLVFHHPDGRMAKIKKRDFGLNRN